MYREINRNLTIIKIIESWATTTNPFNTTEELLEWIKKRNKEIQVNIKKIPYCYDGFWHYDSNQLGIVNSNGSFFQIKGLVKKENGKIIEEQPIIIQDEIGYLGIITKIIDGVLYFLMQAKIEPGNVNQIQISPTIQATKSNFSKAHGGNAPAYLDYFIQKERHEIIIDQIQSEQSSRFYGKRNRNIILRIDEGIELLETHRWMTLGQIKQLMHYDNLVNMDTRTVLSCIPFSLLQLSEEERDYISTLFKNRDFFNSMFCENDSGKIISRMYQYMNEYKMLNPSQIELVDLYSLKKWSMKNQQEFSTENGSFKIIFCDISIEGREVERWQQPLLEAERQSTFGLIYCVDHDCMKFLVQARAEIGCFDKIELAPSVQTEPAQTEQNNPVNELFFKNLKEKKGIKFEGLFSEEGGRFYHEENKNVLMQIQIEELPELPDNYFWVDYRTLNIMIQFNNCLNIQLRNLLSILDL